MTNETIINLAIAALILGAMWGASQIAPVEQAQAAPVQQATPAAQAPIGHKSVVTESMSVNAGFYATDSAAWASQGGMHYGTDYGAPQGSPVFMPFDCIYSMTGHYDDAARMGDYVICHLMDGVEYYSGHLEGVQAFVPGQVIAAGTVIGFTNVYDHTHIQARLPSGELIDFAQYYEEH
jgi:murein DD-endopeptidase MepM/ murein hydrolase activator NlpD